MYYKVFIGNKYIALTDNLSNSDISFSYFNTNFQEIINRIQSGNVGSVVLYHANIDEAWNDFKKRFDVIEAAGGLVENEQKEYLFIYRNGFWDLPKGKMEAGEKPDETAIREVQEECGIQHISIQHYLLDTYHLFTENKKKRLKITHWYKMKEDQVSTLTPQEEEGIEKVAWIDIEKHAEIFNNSYENIRLIIESAK